MGSIHRVLAGGVTNEVRRLGKVSWIPLPPRDENDGTVVDESLAGVYFG
jgi:hypothetical protein